MAHMATELKSLVMCTSTLADWYGPCVLFSVGLILNGLEQNSKGRNLAAAAWLKQNNSQGHGFGIHSRVLPAGKALRSMHGTVFCQGSTAQHSDFRRSDS